MESQSESYIIFVIANLLEKRIFVTVYFYTDANVKCFLKYNILYIQININIFFLRRAKKKRKC